MPLRGSNVARNGSVDHTRKSSKIDQLTLLSDCDSAKASGCCGVSRFSFFSCVIFSTLFAC